MICFKKIWGCAVLGNWLFWWTEVYVVSALGLQLGMGGWSWCLLWGMMENLKGIGVALLWRLGERVSTSGNLTCNQGREPTWRGCCSQHTGYSEPGPASCVCDLCSHTGPMFRRTLSLVYCAAVAILKFSITFEQGTLCWALDGQ